MPTLPACELDESYELAELRKLVEEYDYLIEQCWSTTMDPEDAKLLNELYGYLLGEEYKQWEGASEWYVAQIIAWVDSDFPMIRYNLGIFEDQ